LGHRNQHKQPKTMTEAEQSSTRLSLGRPTRPKKERVYQKSTEAANKGGGLDEVWLAVAKLEAAKWLIE
jgi:hypothetical protein